MNQADRTKYGWSMIAASLACWALACVVGWATTGLPLNWLVAAAFPCAAGLIFGIWLLSPLGGEEDEDHDEFFDLAASRDGEARPVSDLRIGSAESRRRSRLSYRGALLHTADSGEAESLQGPTP